MFPMPFAVPWLFSCLPCIMVEESDRIMSVHLSEGHLSSIHPFIHNIAVFPIPSLCDFEWVVLKGCSIVYPLRTPYVPLSCDMIQACARLSTNACLRGSLSGSTRVSPFPAAPSVRYHNVNLLCCTLMRHAIFVM